MNINGSNSKTSKITHYLYGCMQRSGGEEQLPGETELCRKFGVARGTVQRAVAGLMRGGYIVKRPGRHGFFVNPDMADMIPFSIGIVGNGGVTEILNSGSANALAGFVKTLTRNAECEYLFHDLSSTDPTVIYELARGNGLRGLLWIISNNSPDNVFDSFDEIVKAHFPAVAICFPFNSMLRQPVCNAVTRDYAEAGKRLSRFILENGFRYPLILSEDAVMLENFFAEFRKSGGQISQDNCLGDGPGLEKRLSEALRHGKADCIFSGGGIKLYEALASVMNSVPHANTIPLILRNYFLTNKFIRENPNLNVLLFPELEHAAFMFKSGETAGRMLRRLIEKPNLTIPNVSMIS